MRDHPAWNRERAHAIVAAHRTQRAPLLVVLHALQEEFGYIDEAAVPLLAQELNLSRADVHGVVSFYHDFRRTRPGRHVIKVCRAEACQAMGAEPLAGHIRRRLGIDFHETTADGAFTLEPVFCLGNCALSPAVMLDGRLLGRIDAEHFDALSAACLAEDAR